MRSNINKVAERGEKLEDIGERAGNWLLIFCDNNCAWILSFSSEVSFVIVSFSE